MGDLGRVLYFSYRYLQTKDEKYSKIAKELLEELVNNSNNYVLDSSLGNGITGYYWVILHLIDLEILDLSDENVVKDILPYIEDSIKQDFIKEDYDFLYGCMGKITCLLSSKQKIDVVNLDEVLSFFREIKKTDNKGVFWLDTDKDNQINLGTAHGMPGISSISYSYI